MALAAGGPNACVLRATGKALLRDLGRWGPAAARCGRACGRWPAVAQKAQRPGACGTGSRGRAALMRMAEEATQYFGGGSFGGGGPSLRARAVATESVVAES